MSKRPKPQPFVPLRQSPAQEARIIRFVRTEGISRLTGYDEHGCTWTQFEVDWFAGQEAGQCSICGEQLESGWLCLDDGSQEVCDEHIITQHKHNRRRTR